MATYVQMLYGFVRGPYFFFFFLLSSMKHRTHLTSMHSFTSTQYKHLTQMRLCKNAFSSHTTTTTTVEQLHSPIHRTTIIYVLFFIFIQWLNCKQQQKKKIVERIETTNVFTYRQTHTHIHPCDPFKRANMNRSVYLHKNGFRCNVVTF